MTQRRIYQEEYPYFITFRTREGFLLFNNIRHVSLLSNIIFRAGAIKGFDILSYQIMPDHVHLLVWGVIAGRDTRDGREEKDLSTPTQISAPAVGSQTAPAVGSHKQHNISQLMYTIKSYFVKELRDKYNILYPIWHKRFYARIVDTDKYLQYVVHYIKHNPIKAELPKKYRKFPYQYFNWGLINSL